MKSPLDQEIEWHTKSKGKSGKGRNFEMGFIAGLKHASWLDKKMKKTKPKKIKTPV